MRTGLLAALTGVLAGSFGLLASPARAESVEAPNPGSASPYRLETGVGLRFMPVGWFDLYDGARRTGFRAYPAAGLAVFADYRVSRFVSLGISPELTLNVIPNRSDYFVGKMLVGDARLRLRYPTRTRFEPYAILTGGYSVIWRDGASSATGPVIGGAVGCSVSLSRRHALFGEFDYQKGFQTADGGDYGPSYLIVAAGWRGGFFGEQARH